MTANPSSGTAATSIRTMVYVDGFNLYFGLRSRGYKRFYWLDIQQLAENLLRPGQLLQAVKYFTADIKAGTEKHRRQQTFLDALATHCTKLQIVRGRYLIKQRQCHRCGNVAQIPEEKKTEVNISSHMLVDAFTDQFDTGLLISGDSDLVPPITMIRKYHPAKRILVGFPPGRKSDDLKKVAHSSFWINQTRLRISLLPNPVTKPNGHTLWKPTQWQ